MSDDLDEEFETTVNIIDIEKSNFNDDEQNLIDIWVGKLRAVEDKPLRNEYIKYLERMVARMERRLSYPYEQQPPEGDLPPLQELLDFLRNQNEEAGPSRERRRYICSSPEQKQPCRLKFYPKPPDRVPRPQPNEFVDLEEMAKVIARSKGYMLAEFVAEVSRHTVDKGHEMRKAMTLETMVFNEYVERILNQRIKDLWDLIDDKQQCELMRIQKDYDNWLSELSNCKKQIKELIPDFDLELYKRDKNYMKRIFAVGMSANSSEDNFKEWREESCHRLMWFVNEISKLTEENAEVAKQIDNFKEKTLELEQSEAEKQRCHETYMRTESSKNQQLKIKRDKLGREIADLLFSLRNC